jgi:hypothetical protein
MANPRPPTVQTSRFGANAKAFNALPLGSFGFIEILVQVLPSQWERSLPAAQTSLGPRAASAWTWPGGGSVVHAVSPQRKTLVSHATQTSLGPIAFTASKIPGSGCLPFVVGLGTIVHAVPSQCSTSAREWEISLNPTYEASAGAEGANRRRRPSSMLRTGI